MKRKLKLSPSAIKDIQEGIDYYNGKQKNLGRRFENTMHENFKKILEMPQSASIAYSDVRYKVVDNFPYIITYDFDDATINVFRIFNTNQSTEGL